MGRRYPVLWVEALINETTLRLQDDCEYQVREPLFFLEEFETWIYTHWTAEGRGTSAGLAYTGQCNSALEVIYCQKKGKRKY